MIVRLYTRAGCHLCEIAEAALAAVADEFPHRLETIDIDRDDAARERYRLVIPVVVIDDCYRLVTHIDEASLRRAFALAMG